ncbi:uncharacterized protein DUF262 [Arcticibacter tournemirensis]|uniref:DUF262 domain-containing protein n=1 Tax=Arcticibacter tournemirensis TaxID=699437 RepID=A0A5M9GZH7_9SPHI|nr:winged helix-turn-helix domain-containing protein [Arcticibacter tournemirensis]KAA8478214.1 DUF262 domain-containing protein [Arcticibacter tournemirensis]TQM50761.1 uncharacterized protein DUF262 [Arcticibacter tournemirensis]
MPVPVFEDMMNPTLQALKSLGGEAHIKEIEDKVSELLDLSTEDILEVHKDNRTKLGYRLAWSRNYLKRVGLLERTGRAYWSLTEEGKKAEAVDKDQIIRKIKMLDGRLANDDDEDLLDDDSKSDLDNAILRDQHNPDVEKEDTLSSEIIKPFDPKRIDITSKTLILDSIFKRISRKEINLFTDFQRQGDLWDPMKQSRLIESILIRFPLPAFYFDGTDEDQWLIVDGLQRISTLKNFVIDKTLKLQNLEFLDQFNGCNYDDLPRNLQRRIDEAEITVYIINPGTPDEVKYNVFKRINTTALILEPQEIRHAINQGVPALFVKELADLDEFKRATSYTIKTHRMLDRDFVTRFLSFYLNPYKGYQPDLDTFMNKSMAALKELSDSERLEIKSKFIGAMNGAYSLFGEDAFRKRFSRADNRKPINKALFEVWSVSLAKLTNEDLKLLIEQKDKLTDEFILLLNEDSVFSDSLSSGTGDRKRVTKRFTAIENLIQKQIQQ